MKGTIVGFLTIVLALVLALQGTALAEEAAGDAKAQAQALRKEANSLTWKIRRAVEKCGKENAEIAELLKKGKELARQAEEARNQAKERAAAASPELAEMMKKQKELREQADKLMPKKPKKARKKRPAKKDGKKKE